MSAYAGLHGGALDFLRHPIAPAGTRVLIHDKPGVRSSWAPHGVPGYYLGPPLQHYRSYRVWSSATKPTRISDTLSGSQFRAQAPATPCTLQSHCYTQRILSSRSCLPISVSPPSLALQQSPGILGIPSPPSLGPPVLSTAPQPVLHTTHRPHCSSSRSQDSCAEQRVITATGPPTRTERRMTPPFTDSSLPQSDIHQSHIRPDHSAFPNTCITCIPTTRPTVPLPPQIITHLPRLAATSTFNLDDHGQPLRYSTAKAGINALRWQQAEAEELDRPITTATILPILLDEQPNERRRDTTYYNPQTKEKKNAAGDCTYRIWGTIGGDRIHYPGPTTARTAAVVLMEKKMGRRAGCA